MQIPYKIGSAHAGILERGQYACKYPITLAVHMQIPNNVDSTHADTL